jgi:hypothetical protein
MFPNEYTSTCAGESRAVLVNRESLQQEAIALTTYHLGLWFVIVFFWRSVFTRIAPDKVWTGCFIFYGVRDESSTIEVVQFPKSVDFDVLSRLDIGVGNCGFSFGVNVMKCCQAYSSLCCFLQKQITKV